MTETARAAPTADQQKRLRQAARALAATGLVHAYGHCSLRLSADAFLVCAPLPMGLIGQEEGTVVGIDGPLPPGVLGEVRAHQAIYRRRPDVFGVCRIMPPILGMLSTQAIVPRPRHGLGAYFHPGPAFYGDPRLLRDEESAARLAATLGDLAAVVMRGNGAIVVADGIEKAVTLSWFLEDAARVERDVRMLGASADTGVLNADEIAARQVFSGGVVERMWAWMTQGDPEGT